MDPGTEQIGVGGALFLGALTLILKYKPWAQAARKDDVSGQKTTEFWQLEIRRIVEEGVREAMRGRNEEIRRILREELNRNPP